MNLEVALCNIAVNVNRKIQKIVNDEKKCITKFARFFKKVF